MGGGASVLSSEDFVTMSQNLKEEYELLISAGHTDDEIRVKLMEKYNQLFVTSDAVSVGTDIVMANAVLTDGSLPITAAGIEISAGETDEKIAVTDEKIDVAPTVPETTVGLTEKAKKARKRRGTFENDKVVAASKKEPVAAASAVLVEPVPNQ